MKALRFNADYELDLFYGQKGPEILNHSLEFMLFFLTNNPVLTQKKYDSGYLDHVEHISGHRPTLIKDGPYENYWGMLKNRELEKWWNSKLTTTELIIKKGWCSDTHILKSEDDVIGIGMTKDALLKDPHGMSGQKFQVLPREMIPGDKLSIVRRAIKNGPLILEPLLNRKYDFSQYIFPDGKKISYQNIVDEKFQYKGSIFHDYKRANLESLSFYQEIDKKYWSLFSKQIEDLITFFSQQPNECGYSIDSFIFEEMGELKIRPVSEINYRRTMGRISYELSLLYGGHRPWSMFMLQKSIPDKIPLWQKLKPLELSKHSSNGLVVLSPGDTRFDMLFLSAMNQEEGQSLKYEMQKLLANT